MFAAMIGQSPNFEAMLRSAKMVAATDVTVLTLGETGTGKELLAKALQGQRSTGKKTVYHAELCRIARVTGGIRTVWSPPGGIHWRGG